MITGILIGDGISRKPEWQIIKFRGKPLLLYPLEALQNSKVDDLLLAIGRDYHLILNKIKFKLNKTRIIMNRRFERGLSSYVRAALSFVSPNTEAILIASGEYPFLKASSIDRMIEFFKKDKAGILVPSYEGELGKIFIFDKKYIKYLKRLQGNDIGESIIRKFIKDVHRLEVKNPGIVKGIDKIQDLESLDSGEIDRIEKEAALKDVPTPIQKDKIPSPKDAKKVPKGKTFLTKGAKTKEIPTPQKENKELSLKMLNDLLGKGVKGMDMHKAKHPSKTSNIKDETPS